MFVRLIAVMSVSTVMCSGLVLARPDTSSSGSLPGWQDGEAEVVLLEPRHVPPPFVRPSNSTTIGRVAADGRFSIYDFSVGAGWHEIVQSFAEHPEQPGWRVDRWRKQSVPEDAVRVLIRPPR